jgi:hypothetical protein
VRSGCLTFSIELLLLENEVYGLCWNWNQCWGYYHWNSRLSIKRHMCNLGIPPTHLANCYCKVLQIHRFDRKKKLSLFIILMIRISKSQYCRTPLHLLKRRIIYGNKIYSTTAIHQSSLHWNHIIRSDSVALFSGAESQPWKFANKMMNLLSHINWSAKKTLWVEIIQNKSCKYYFKKSVSILIIQRNQITRPLLNSKAVHRLIETSG